MVRVKGTGRAKVISSTRYLCSGASAWAARNAPSSGITSSQVRATVAGVTSEAMAMCQKITNWLATTGMINSQ